MASPICTLPLPCSSSLTNSSSRSTLQSYFKHPNFILSLRSSQTCLCRHFTPWSGLRFIGVSISPNPKKTDNSSTSNQGSTETVSLFTQGRSKWRGKVFYASLFGVGAPEALVIGVVALLVFGPKGLAEVARNLGKTLRAFQPTIRELQEVSREFKSTLEREIGLDDDLNSVKNSYGSSGTNSTLRQSAASLENSGTASVATDPNGAPPNNSYSSEEYLKITEEQLKSSAIAPQDISSSPPESQIRLDGQPQAAEVPAPFQKPENET